MYFYYRNVRDILSIGSVYMDKVFVENLEKLDDERKMLKFLRQYFIEKNYQDALICLDFAIDVHKDQKRAGGQPYIVHPLAVVIHGILNHLDHETFLHEETFLGAGIDHDTIEDYPTRIEEFNSLPISDEIKKCVHILNKTPYRQKYPNDKNRADDEYYQGIGQSIFSSYIKLEDRLHNFKTMDDGFDLKRKIKYLKEFYHRYPTLMFEMEQKMAYVTSFNPLYSTLKQELYEYANYHKQEILKELNQLSPEQKSELEQDLGTSRKKIA